MANQLQHILALSMRMVRQRYAPGNEELRDALAQDWWSFLTQVLPHIAAIPMPNTGKHALTLLDALPVCGIVLTGGDDWGAFPQRDATETALWTWAEQHNLPVLGVCRGAQVINRLLGGSISTDLGPDHSGTRHCIVCDPCAGLPRTTGERQVNSFHRCGFRQEDLASSLTAWAWDTEGHVEAFASANGRVVGVLWHPEREQPVQTADVALFNHLFHGECR